MCGGGGLGRGWGSKGRGPPEACMMAGIEHRFSDSQLSTASPGLVCTNSINGWCKKARQYQIPYNPVEMCSFYQ